MRTLGVQNVRFVVHYPCKNLGFHIVALGQHPDRVFQHKPAAREDPVGLGRCNVRASLAYCQVNRPALCFLDPRVKKLMGVPFHRCWLVRAWVHFQPRKVQEIHVRVVRSPNHQFQDGSLADPGDFAVFFFHGVLHDVQNFLFGLDVVVPKHFSVLFDRKVMAHIVLLRPKAD